LEGKNMMTKKDYIRAANAIAWLRKDERRRIDMSGREPTSNIVEQTFIEFFRGDNPRFDKERFQEACKKDPSGT
jgi:hypothetical protein